MIRRKTNEEYIQECKQKGYDLPIESYVNARVKIKHKCNKCGNVYLQSPDSHLVGKGCPICGGTQRKTNEKYIEECKSKGYDLPIESYVTKNVKIKHKCNKCRNIYLQSPDSHLHGRGCPKCGVNRQHKALIKSTQQYIKECKQSDIDLPLESYVDSKTKIKHKCNNCGNIYLQAPKEHVGARKQGCPICSQSHGEKFIQNYLDKYNIPYIPQRKFNDLKDKALLSYDFHLPEQKVLIEYQGIQHFESVSFGSNSTDLTNQKYHDKLKREYAKKNDYTLLEPTYKLDTQDKVNNYLDKHLNN